MSRVLCAIFGHRVMIRWFWHSYRMRGLQCCAECRRCGKELTRLETPPLQRKTRR